MKKNKKNIPTKVMEKIGEGQYGTIYKAKCIVNGKKQCVALKRVTYSAKTCNNF